MKGICCLAVIVFMLITGCSTLFTKREMKLLKEGEGKMRLWTVDVPEEAVFLRKKARALEMTDMLSDDFQRLKDRMLATVTDTTNPGVGIAAPQVGIGGRIIAVQRFDKEEEPFEFYVNPVITYYSDAKICGPEGCLSIPNARDSVWRSEEIIVQYMGFERNKNRVETDSVISIKIKRECVLKTDTVKGFTAVIFQHEIDHLDGILFTDRIKNKK